MIYSNWVSVMGISWTFIGRLKHHITHVHLYEVSMMKNTQGHRQPLDPSEGGLGDFMTIDLAGHTDLIPLFVKASSSRGRVFKRGNIWNTEFRR
jgi:hypothetical protein